MRKVYIALVALIVGVGFYFAPPLEDDIKVSMPKKAVELAEVATLAVVAMPKIGVLPISPKERKKIEGASKKPVYLMKEKQNIDDSFEEVDVHEIDEKVKPKPNVTPLNAFKMKQGTIKSLYSGDTLVLPVINDFEYTVNVTKRTVNEDGSVVITASIEGEDPRYYSILTEGDNTSFVTLNTSNGVYEMETTNGVGYTYSAKEVQDSMSDYSKVDTLKAPAL